MSLRVGTASAPTRSLKTRLITIYILSLASALYCLNLGATFAFEAARWSGDWRWNLTLLALTLGDLAAVVFMSMALARALKGKLSEGHFWLIMLLTVPALAFANFFLIGSYASM
jgi:hypothetical protein